MSFVSLFKSTVAVEDLLLSQCALSRLESMSSNVFADLFALSLISVFTNSFLTIATASSNNGFHYSSLYSSIIVPAGQH